VFEILYKFINWWRLVIVICECLFSCVLANLCTFSNYLNYLILCGRVEARGGTTTMGGRRSGHGCFFVFFKKTL
jgi:hypothetical protein